MTLFVANYSNRAVDLYWNNEGGWAPAHIPVAGQVSISDPWALGGVRIPFPSLMIQIQRYGAVADSTLASGSSFKGLCYSTSGPIDMTRLVGAVDRTIYQLQPLIAY